MFAVRPRFGANSLLPDLIDKKADWIAPFFVRSAMLDAQRTPAGSTLPDGIQQTRAVRTLTSLYAEDLVITI